MSKVARLKFPDCGSKYCILVVYRINNRLCCKGFLVSSLNNIGNWYG